MNDNQKGNQLTARGKVNEAELYAVETISREVDRALASSRMEMAYASRASVDQLTGLVHAASEAVLLLIAGGFQKSETESCIDGLTQQLGKASLEVVRRVGEFREPTTCSPSGTLRRHMLVARLCAEYLPNSKRDAVG